MAYIPTAAEYRRLAAVTDERFRQCLKKRDGKEYRSTGRVGDIDPHEGINSFGSVWGVVRTEAEIKKYGLRRVVDAGQISYAPTPSDEALSECMHEIMREGVNARQMVALGGLPDGGPRLAEHDARIQPIVQEWSSCMKEKGFSAAVPTDLFSQYIYKTAAVSPEEVSAGLADLECKKQSNLVARLLAWQLVYDREYMETHRAALDEYRARMNNLMAEHG